MPAARPSARALALAALLASLLALPAPLPTPTRVAACPVVPPTPLRMLYKKSALVVVAEAGETARELSAEPLYEGGPRMVTLKTTFHVSESLKGDPSETRPVVNFWGGYAGMRVEGDYQKGDRALLFLEADEGRDGYTLADYRYGAKRLPEDDLKVYVQRIRELSAILGTEKPDEAALLEWLVRCAEEKATRWEGAYELSATIVSTDEEEEEEEEQVSLEEGGEGEEPAAEEGPAEDAAGEEAAAEETTEESPEAAQGEAPVEGSAENVTLARLGGLGTDLEPGFASKLSDEQRERLHSALFKADEVGDGEIALLRLARDSGDARLVPFLVKHLQGMDAEPTYDAHPLILALAHALDDKEIKRLAKDYVSNAPYTEYVEEEEEAAAEGEEADYEGEDEEEADSGEPKVKGVDRRREMLRAFLAAVDNKIQYDLAMQLSR